LKKYRVLEFSPMVCSSSKVPIYWFGEGGGLYAESNYLGGIIESQIIMTPSPALPLKGKGDQPH